MHTMLDADPRAVMAFARVQRLARYRRDLPLDAWYAVKLMGAMHEDCGPCAQLVVTLAERDGVAAPTIAAVARDDAAALGPDLRLVVAWTRACLARDPAADAHGEAMLARWGPRALVSAALALASSRVFPTVKRALGHGKACARLVVSGEPIATGPTRAPA